MTIPFQKGTRRANDGEGLAELPSCSLPSRFKGLGIGIPWWLAFRWNYSARVLEFHVAGNRVDGIKGEILLDYD